MIPYNQTVAKISTTETITLKECIRRMSDSIDKRFCFDVLGVDKSPTYTFQALSEEDRKLWLDAMDGKDPPLPSSSSAPGKLLAAPRTDDCCQLDEVGFAFVRKCIEVIECRGIDDQGLYRVGGVSSKVTRLVQGAFDPKRNGGGGPGGNVFHFDFDTSDDTSEIRTITSALKHYFRNLPDPLLTFKLHTAFIASAKQEHRGRRFDDVHRLVHQLPKLNFDMLRLLIYHLRTVANNAEKNLMPVNNLAVCLGPSLLRPEEESVTAIMETKFANVVVEILIENCDKIFNSKPSESSNISYGVSSPNLSFADGVQQHHQQQPIGLPSSNSSPSVGFGRGSAGFTSEPEQSLYASVPGRTGVRGPDQVYRSGSQDQLAHQHQQQQQQPQQYRNRGHPPNYGYHQQQQQPPATIYQPTGHPQANGNRGPYQRPVAVAFNPWTADHQQQQQQANKHSSPGMDSGVGSGELLSNAHHQGQFQQQHQQQQSMADSPRSSPSSSGAQGAGPGGGTSSYYSYGSSNGRPPPLTPGQFHNNPLPSSSSSSTSAATTNAVVVQPQPTTTAPTTGRKVRTLYACMGENSAELSFEPNVVIHNVRPSREPGWLEGYYGGRVGLLPENYVQYLD